MVKHKDQEPSEPEIQYCKVEGCGGILNDDRFCDKGQGYPFYIQHQAQVCPHCRKPLHWTGNCMTCWSRYESKGPGYYFEDVDGHWQNTGAQQRMFTKEEIREKMGELARTLKVGVDDLIPF